MGQRCSISSLVFLLAACFAICVLGCSKSSEELVDLQRERASTVRAGNDGEVVFRMDRPADFRFYRYSMR